MSWKKHLRVVEPGKRYKGYISSNDGMGTSAKYSSYLPEVYAGQPQRIERYNQYDQMDTDSVINMALDTIANFCTQTEEQEATPFNLKFYEEANENEIEILNESLKRWTRENKFKQRLFRIVRNTIKYGDSFFIRDPETCEWLTVSQYKIQSIIVNEAEGKKPDTYNIQDLDLNLQTKVATKPTNVPGNIQTVGAYGGATQVPQTAAPDINQTNYNNASRNLATTGLNNVQSTPITANSVIHISLSEGLDSWWPFGTSVLESIFKTFKQKSLLEDALIIYRVQRAPERRVFYIDVGNMPTHQAMKFVERVKNQMHQRRIPNRTGGGQSILDGSYDPLAILEDFFLAQTCINPLISLDLLDGRTITLAECIKEYEEGKVNYVYSLNRETHEMEPGKITWAGYTRKNAQQLRITLDNGKDFLCTPDHRVILRDGTELEAQYLTEGTSLMPLYLIDAKTDKTQHASKYKKYICNKTGVKKWVHTQICPKTKTGKETEIHHIDFNSLNNNPDNLIEMNTIEHRQLHKDVGTYSLTKQWNDPVAREKLITGMKESIAKKINDPIENEKLRKRNSINGSKAWINPKQNVIEGRKKGLELIIKHRTIKYSFELFQRFKEIYDPKLSANNLLQLLENDIKFMDVWKTTNSHLNFNDASLSTWNKLDNRKLSKICNAGGYKSITEFKNQFKNNHKVAKIEWIEERADMCDITIESPSNSHVFAISAGIYVHNSDGRGSKIDTLPGGEIGSIDDLKFFDNKLKQGLRIPESYLPSSGDPGSQFSDGRVGTAYLQEFIFSKYCKRLQNLISPIFDTEFKYYLKQKGINIDLGMFELEFHEPQNFSKFRQIEIDSAQINIFQPLSEVRYLSKQFLLKRFLNLSEDEILENERLWKQENVHLLDAQLGPVEGGAMGGMPGQGLVDLGSAGIRPPDQDLDNLGEIGLEDETSEESSTSQTTQTTTQTPGAGGGLDFGAPGTNIGGGTGGTGGTTI